MDRRSGSYPQLVAHVAATDPDRMCVQEVGGREATYGQLRDSGLSWCAVLQAAGVGVGEPVLTMLPSSLASIEVWLGISLARAIEAPINPNFRGQLLEHVINDSRATVAVVDARLLAGVRDALEAATSVARIIVLGDDVPSGGKVVALDDLAVDAPAALSAFVGIGMHEISTLLYTSGTTGHSKGVLVPWAQLEETSLGMLEPGDIGPEDAFYVPYPPYHITWKAALASMAQVGAKVVVRERFDTEEFWDDVRKYGGTTVVLLGAMVNFLYRQPERHDDADNPLRNVVMVPVIPEVEDFKRRFGVRVKALWNMTEASTQISSRDWDVSNHKSCGKAREGTIVQLVDDLDNPVAPGEVGELVVRPARPWTLNAGYWRNPEATVEAWRNLWFHTGDLMTYDEDGSYYFVDRKKDAIRRRGENISSAEVEFAVLEHDGIQEAAAVAVDSEWGEQEVMVFVVPKPGVAVSAQEVDAVLEGRITPFMRPKYIEVIETLPKTVTEKIRKVELRQRGVGPATWVRPEKRRS